MSIYNNIIASSLLGLFYPMSLSSNSVKSFSGFDFLYSNTTNSSLKVNQSSILSMWNFFPVQYTQIEWTITRKANETVS